MKNIKDKIEKLLNLSLSENEHEAKLALEKALKLMNKHNITEEEVYKQQMINRKYTLNNIYRVPDWLSMLYANMSILSGCVFTWTNGRNTGFGFKREAVMQITGRERDVENAFYLIHFLHKKINSLAKEYKKTLAYSHSSPSEKATMNKSYKVGLIFMVGKRLAEQQSSFFNEQSKGTDLVCVDIKTKVSEADSFLRESSSQKIVVSDSKAKYERDALEQGKTDAEKIELHQAMSGQKETRMLA